MELLADLLKVAFNLGTREEAGMGEEWKGAFCVEKDQHLCDFSLLISCCWYSSCKSHAAPGLGSTRLRGN